MYVYDDDDTRFLLVWRTAVGTDPSQIYTTIIQKYREKNDHWDQAMNGTTDTRTKEIKTTKNELLGNLLSAWIPFIFLFFVKPMFLSYFFFTGHGKTLSMSDDRKRSADYSQQLTNGCILLVFMFHSWLIFWCLPSYFSRCLMIYPKVFIS